MKNNNPKRISKALSLALRHRPEAFDLNLDEQGWCSVAQLLVNFQKKNIEIDRLLLEDIVRTNDKQRFAISEDGRKIRANQGHSIQIDLGFSPVDPPEYLYHGTAEKFIPSIRKEGLQKRKRHHVHLSANIETAWKVGQRHGKPVILTVLAKEMVDAGHLFYCSENDVWLTDEVPIAYLQEEKNNG